MLLLSLYNVLTYNVYVSFMLNNSLFWVNELKFEPRNYYHGDVSPLNKQIEVKLKKSHKYKQQHVLNV